MVKKIDGSAIAERIKDVVAREIFAHQEERPSLAIILVGERPDSRLYVSLKQREGRKVGIDTHLYEMTADTPEAELLEVVSFLNRDPHVDGILIQLPLPENINADRVIAALDPAKDVDGFHPDHPDYLLSPVLASILACLEETKFNPAGKTACVLYNSEVFGRSVRDLLAGLGMIVNLKVGSQEADLLVTALGEPHKIKKEMIKEGAVIIDIGITSDGDKVLGDVDWDDVASKAAWATPVPGGIGPMTIAFLFKNTLEIFKRNSL